MSTHISKVEALAITLEQMKQPQTETAVMTTIIISLPESYLGFRRAWNSVHPSLKTKD